MAACTKPYFLEDDNAEASLLRIENFKATIDIQSQKQKYSLLSAPEKYQIWATHLQRAKIQFLESGHFEKSASISYLLDKLIVSVFSQAPTAAKDVFFNYHIPIWSSKAKNIFSEQEIYDLTSDPAKQIIGALTASDRAPKVSCFCHVGQVGFSCTSSTLVIGIPPSYTIQQGVCICNTDCKETSSGCGWFWYYSCNGRDCNFG